MKWVLHLLSAPTRGGGVLGSFQGSFQFRQSLPISAGNRANHLFFGDPSPKLGHYPPSTDGYITQVAAPNLASLPDPGPEKFVSVCPAHGGWTDGARPGSSYQGRPTRTPPEPLRRLWDLPPVPRYAQNYGGRFWYLGATPLRGPVGPD